MIVSGVAQGSAATSVHPRRGVMSDPWGRGRGVVALTASAALAAVVPDGVPAALGAVGFAAVAASMLRSPAWVVSKVLVVVALMAIPVPLLALATRDLGAADLARAGVIVAAIGVAGLRAATPPRAGARAPRGRGSGTVTWVVLAGAMLLANSYLLRGRGGALSLMDHDHVFHAAVITSVWSADANPGLWVQATAGELRAVPSAVHWSAAAWVARVIPEPLLIPVIDRVEVLAAVALIGATLGWIGVVATARPVALAVQTRRLWVVLPLVSALLGPVLWLRYSGMWPALLAAGYLGLAAACYGEGAQWGGRLAVPPRYSLALTGVCLTLAIQAWPLVAVPVLAAAGMVFVAASRVGEQLPRRALGFVLLASSVLAGTAWSVATVERGVGSLGSGPGGLGLPDWRLWAVAGLLVAFLTASHRVSQPQRPPATVWTALVGAGLVAGTGVAIDLIFSASTSLGATYYAGKLALMGALVAMPSSVMWLSAGTRGGDARSRRLWALACSVICAAGVSIWFPWGSDYFPYGSTGPAPAVGALMESVVDDRNLVTDQAALDSRVLSCGLDGVIRWPAVSNRAGTYKYSTMWTATVGGRVDPSGWAVTKDALPPLGGAVTVEQQLSWFGLGGQSPRTIAWVVPDNDAPALALRIASFDLPPKLYVKVLGTSQFEEEALRCAAARA